MVDRAQVAIPSYEVAFTKPRVRNFTQKLSSIRIYLSERLPAFQQVRVPGNVALPRGVVAVPAARRPLQPDDPVEDALVPPQVGRQGGARRRGRPRPRPRRQQLCIDKVDSHDSHEKLFSGEVQTVIVKEDEAAGPNWRRSREKL